LLWRRAGGVFNGAIMLNWRNTLTACVIAAYLAWSANNLWHDWQAAPVECEPVPVGVEVMV